MWYFFIFLMMVSSSTFSTLTNSENLFYIFHLFCFNNILFENRIKGNATSSEEISNATYIFYSILSLKASIFGKNLRQKSALRTPSIFQWNTWRWQHEHENINHNHLHMRAQRNNYIIHFEHKFLVKSIMTIYFIFITHIFICFAQDKRRVGKTENKSRWCQPSGKLYMRVFNVMCDTHISEKRRHEHFCCYIHKEIRKYFKNKENLMII